MNKNNWADKLAFMNKAMKAAHLQLCVTNNLLVTDRPDLPCADDTSWTTDHRTDLAGLEGAMKLLEEISTVAIPNVVCVVSAF
ncbi:MAG: hypothetical protein M3495_06680 [Pseudomonadota bacterium]|nr:hypothetical protein [Gammaproteobacteria bacterium]MDQ3581301.1 hypothetical protein [Pseudomonadota bacterium]